MTVLNYDNKVIRKYLNNASFYELVRTHFGAKSPQILSEQLQCYRLTAEMLSVTSSDDPAWRHLYEVESDTRRLLLAQHLGDENAPDKELCMVINTYRDPARCIEIFDAYGFGYKPHNHYVAHKPQGLVMDLRGKDFEDSEFLDACDLIELYATDIRYPKARISLEYAPCFFWH